MMEIEDKRNHMGAAVGLRYRIGQSGTPAAKMSIGGREPDFEGTFAAEFVADGRRAVHAGET
jgi:hypothetical protein